VPRRGWGGGAIQGGEEEPGEEVEPHRQTVEENGDVEPEEIEVFVLDEKHAANDKEKEDSGKCENYARFWPLGFDPNFL
jgi:hypothetical protein